MNVNYFIVEDLFENRRFDYWFKLKYPHLNKSFLEKLFRTGQIRVDGRRIKSSYRLKVGEKIRVPPNIALFSFSSTLKKPTNNKELGKKIIERILYYDANLLVLDKPQGLAVQGGSKILESLDDVLEYLKFDAVEKPKLVHRLDKDTGGVLILARNTHASNKITNLL